MRIIRTYWDLHHAIESGVNRMRGTQAPVRSTRLPRLQGHLGFVPRRWVYDQASVEQPARQVSYRCAACWYQGGKDSRSPANGNLERMLLVRASQRYHCIPCELTFRHTEKKMLEKLKRAIRSKYEYTPRWTFKVNRTLIVYWTVCSAFRVWIVYINLNVLRYRQAIQFSSLDSSLDCSLLECSESTSPWVSILELISFWTSSFLMLPSSLPPKRWAIPVTTKNFATMAGWSAIFFHADSTQSMMVCLLAGLMIIGFGFFESSC